MEHRIREKRRMYVEDVISRKVEVYNKMMFKKPTKKGKKSKKKN